MLQEEFSQTINELMDLLTSFSTEQFNQVPYPGSWTAGQVGEHLFKTYQIVKLLQRDNEPLERAADEKVDLIRSVMADIETRRQAPDSVVPSTDALEQGRLLGSLQKRIEEFKEIIVSKNLQEACPNFSIPQFGEFSKLEWVYFNLYHTQRHIQQLKKIAEAFGVN